MMAVAKKTAPKTAITVEMNFERSTKGTHVFSAKEDTAPVPTLYVRKSGFDGKVEVPESIIVTIESA
jgi:hypothetical protein